MPHPQNSPRGLFSKKGINIGGQAVSGNSSGVTFPGYVRVSGKSTGALSANSTALIVAGPLRLNSKSTGQISANSTAILVPASGLQMAALTSLKITSNSTGIRIGARYISTNTTGNATT